MSWLRRTFITGFFLTVPLVISVAALVWLARQGAGRRAGASGVEALLAAVAHRRQLICALKPASLRREA